MSYQGPPGPPPGQQYQQPNAPGPQGQQYQQPFEQGPGPQGQQYQQQFAPSQGPPQGQQYQQSYGPAGSQDPVGPGGIGAPPRRSETERLMPQGQERTEQMETFQSYEASKPQTDADRDQETLQREFPKLDSSLIAAIYNDSGSLGATREMLQGLAASEA